MDCLTITLSGLVGVVGIIKSLKENKITKETAVIHGALQFVFCVDVISSILIYRRNLLSTLMRAIIAS